MHTGILLLGIVCQITGAFIVQDQLRYASSLWFGILFALVAGVHMSKTIERALLSGAAAGKIATAGYLFRYFAAVVLLGVIAATDVMNVLVVFMGYMSLKITAYLQPLIHRIYNGIFHETDPVPEALPEEQPSGEGCVS